MEGFLRSIPAAAGSPYALAAYAIAALLFLFAGAKLQMTRMLLSKIASIPESERRRALEIATGTVLPTRVSAEQWIRHSRLRWMFLLSGSLLIVVLALATIAILNPTKATVEEIKNNTQQTAKDTQEAIKNNTRQTAKQTEETIKNNTQQTAKDTQEAIHRSVTRLSDPILQVEYYLEEFTGANVLIGNRGQDIIIVSELTLHWSYQECPEFTKPQPGAPLVTYRYTADLTKSIGSKVLDTRDFKYGSGDVDKFRIDLTYPDYGIYTVWLTFKYKRLGDQSEQRYETQHDDRRVCEKY